jgi:hypothetical protein
MAAKLLLRLTGRFAARTIQVLFAIFVVFLHPQIQWLIRQVLNSAFVQHYLKPAFRRFSQYIYEPFFDFLGRLSPYWAAFSIALPLLILEPAKFGATILITQRPKTGILLWLGLQGLSFILIDRTWIAVRPQCRKIRLASLIHAWIWLNVAYGKHWIKSSSVYRMLMIWRRRARRSLNVSPDGPYGRA